LCFSQVDEQDEAAAALQEKKEDEAKRTAGLIHGSLSTGRLTKQEQLKTGKRKTLRTLDESHEDEIDETLHKRPRLTQGEMGYAMLEQVSGVTSVLQTLVELKKNRDSSSSDAAIVGQVKNLTSELASVKDDVAQLSAGVSELKTGLSEILSFLRHGHA
jgi:hypothetical protein